MSWPGRVVQAQQGELPAPEAWTALNTGDAGRAADCSVRRLSGVRGTPILHFGAGWAAHALGRNDAAISSLKKAWSSTASPRRRPSWRRRVCQQRPRPGDPLDGEGGGARAARSGPSAGSSNSGGRNRRPCGVRPSVTAGASACCSRGPAAGARRRVEGLESAYWSLGKTLNSYPSDTLMVVLYTNKQFQDVTRAPAWAGGEFDGRIRLAVGGAMRTPGALNRVVRHELVHAIIQHAAPRNVPTWVNEGLASVLESTGPHLGRPGAEREPRDLPGSSDLADGFGHLDGARALVAYAGERRGRAGSDRAPRPESGACSCRWSAPATPSIRRSARSTCPPRAFHAEWRKRVRVR